MYTQDQINAGDGVLQAFYAAWSGNTTVTYDDFLTYFANHSASTLLAPTGGQSDEDNVRGDIGTYLLAGVTQAFITQQMTALAEASGGEVPLFDPFSWALQPGYPVAGKTYISTPALDPTQWIAAPPASAVPPTQAAPLAPFTLPWWAIPAGMVAAFGVILLKAGKPKIEIQAAPTVGPEPVIAKNPSEKLKNKRKWQFKGPSFEKRALEGFYFIYTLELEKWSNEELRDDVAELTQVVANLKKQPQHGATKRLTKGRQTELNCLRREIERRKKRGKWF